MKNCTADALNVKLQEFKTAVHSNKADKKYSVTNLRSRNSSSNHSLTRFNVKTRNEVFKARQVCYIISGEETNLHPSNLPASLSISTSLCLVTKMLFDIQLFFWLCLTGWASEQTIFHPPQRWSQPGAQSTN